MFNFIFSGDSKKKEEKTSTKVEVVTPTLSRTVIVKDAGDVKKFMVEQIKERDKILEEIFQESSSSR